MISSLGNSVRFILAGARMDLGPILGTQDTRLEFACIYTHILTQSFILRDNIVKPVHYQHVLGGGSEV